MQEGEKGLLRTGCIFAVGWIGLGLGARRHAGQDCEVGLDLRPRGWILLGGDRRRRIGVVGLDVFLDAGRNGLRGRSRETVKQIGVGGVSERITSGSHDEASIKIAIGQRMAGVPRRVRPSRTAGSRRGNASEPLPQSRGGEHDTVQVSGLSLLGRAFDGSHLERPYLWDDEDNAG